MIFINISQYEATLFFLAVYLPSFVIIVAIGYFFATGSRLEKLDFWRMTILTALIILCLTLSSLSIFNLVSLVGGIFALAAVILAFATPTFRTLWKREACFFVETGTILSLSGSMLFLLMWVISRFFETYSTGMYDVSPIYPYLLLVITTLSFLTFAATPYLGLYGNNVGISGILAATLGALSILTLFQNQYVYFNPSLYLGLLMVGVGTVMTFLGAFVFVRLSLSSSLFSPSTRASFLYKGSYCPNCGEPWTDSRSDICASCKRSLKQELKVSFCPYCGRLTSKNATHCMHCNEEMVSLPVYISLVEEEEKEKVFVKALDRVDFSLKDLVFTLSLTFIFMFLSFILYARTDTPGFGAPIVFYHGYPLEWLQVSLVLIPVRIPHAQSTQSSLTASTVSIEWVALLIDALLYFVLAFVIVYMISKLRSRR
jgi:hypothetical protein